MKPKLAVDKDEVIGGFIDPFTAWVEEEYGMDMTKPTAREPHRHEFYMDVSYGPAPDHTWPHLINREFLINQSLERIAPITGVVEALGRLASHYEIHVVTARPSYTREVTEAWLDQHIPTGLIADLHMPTDTDQDPKLTNKGSYCRELGAIALVDDANYNVLSARDAGVMAISFGDNYYAYGAFGKNDVPAGIHKAYTWGEVEGILVPHAKRVQGESS